MYRDSRSKKFYDSEEWRRTKQRVLDLDGMDVYEYMTTGRIIAPDTVHHVIPLRDDWSLRCDPSNLSQHRRTPGLNRSTGETNKK